MKVCTTRGCHKLEGHVSEHGKWDDHYTFPETLNQFAAPAEPRPERTDHTAEALVELEYGEHQIKNEEFARADYAMKKAQAHATLALVEQQRIGNIIAYWQLHTPRSAVESYEHKSIEVSLIESETVGNIDDLVREALGLS